MSNLKEKYLVKLESHQDQRGGLVAIESLKNIPFEIKRVYYLYNLKSEYSRGFHAHKKLHQLIICLKGSCDFLLDDGHNREIIKLDAPDMGLIVKNMMWREMHNFSNDAVVVVLASEYYDKDDYIHDYNEFKKLSSKE